MKTLLTHAIILGIALPLQLGLVPFNAAKRWLTPGELRFWTIAVFILIELIYLAIS
jgi:hypothetical protein